ncbi:MAG: flavodoxin family protein [Anaerolineae bacterium]|jgi:NAD(P)H dehydrogenase (quinone)
MKVAIVYHSETGNTERMAELVAEGCRSVGSNVEVRLMRVSDPDAEYLRECRAIIFGCPTYEASCSWQMKRYLDTAGSELEGKLAGFFVSQNWPGGGGGSVAELMMIAGALVRGMIVYSGGITQGYPYLHLGAVSARAPEDPLYRERCLHLGRVITGKALELFGD